ncbi:UDP-N-acetylglucosamine 2-epimerase [Chitinophaga rhizophila]|uniref:UDP-N-acetylglucosamine 2-epimerase n=1 Tax=Chitinophaga rhizophila TaxID=2866212 RepID=A0ABS7G8M9_9BACT|nr:UDP-N-acetylglucosamine 2-epimerase [Chitinophaga rhizophila]MBW8683144.1 UDP-N-acetylglucosamine 2-epimerase [Chitinophaga rhizophila]
MLMPITIDHLVDEQIQLANATSRPLYLIIVATKPCYIKLASLILALSRNGSAFLAIDVGQHYEKKLVHARHELQYEHLISVYLNVRGDLLGRTAELAERVNWLYLYLKNRQFKGQAIPVISGDTSTAGMFPILWYFKTRLRSIHVEAGLRSFSPFIRQQIPDSFSEILDMQRERQGWNMIQDEPFPEAADTRLASVCSQLFFTPVSLNTQNMLREGTDSKDIHQVGSLSADALSLIMKEPVETSVFDVYPFLSEGRWLRIDIHRRENISYQVLSELFKAIQELCGKGVRIVIVVSNALNKGIRTLGLENVWAALQQQEGVRVTPLWTHYQHVIEFMRSPHCQGIYTDSGGLQEETQVLDIPCITCRYSTDRPETILHVQNNILVPPSSASLISSSLEFILENGRSIFTNSDKLLYGKDVGDRIAGILGEYNPLPVPAMQDIFDDSVL